MEPPVKIAPSILSADFAQLGAQIKAIDEAGADYIHVDVMDGHFVPNITLGPSIIKAVRKVTQKPFDVHLMISPSAPYIEAFAKAGADIISVHGEADPHIYRTLQTIKGLGKKAGLVLNPGTPASVVDPLLSLVDMILIMTVNPGFGGQSFLEDMVPKISIVHQKIKQTRRAIELQVDGGITPQTAKVCRQAGANVLVAGTSVFKDGPQQYAHNIAQLRK